jgi:hypothetical protein
MRTGVLALCLLSAVPGLVQAETPDAAGTEFFERKVRPVLVEHCYKCHSLEAKKPKGGLLLDSRQGIRKGGDTGPAVLPGQPGKSLLLKAIHYADDELKMPPSGKLPETVIADLRRWIEMGAPDPRDKALPTGALSWPAVLRSRRQWWSLQPVHKPEVPKIQNRLWSNHPIDHFLLARLEQAGIRPNGPADRRTLIRRLSLVLTGLPPEPDQVEAFARDDSPRAYESLVDRLLASPHFGERWARHWMDVVRYAETHGFEWNYEVHHAWRYRDYLIRAFNEDVPYDQLVREHIAGDLLPEPRWNRKEDFNESIIGTAFYRFGEVGHDDCIEFREIGLDALDNQIDTLSKAFQATTIACARCHDHKLDAVSMRDYYALLGILRSSRQVSHTIDGPSANREGKTRLRELKTQIRKELVAEWLREADQIGEYLLVAESIKDKSSSAAELAKKLDQRRLEKWTALLAEEKAPADDPLWLWRSLGASSTKSFAAAWQDAAARFKKESQERADFNAKNFVPFGDFRTARLQAWQATGQGLSDGPLPSGDFAVAGAGDSAVAAVLPAGFFTHSLSEKLNGALRSPLVPKGKKYLSLLALGGKAGAARLVTNNCQLNYRNFHYLKSTELKWLKLTTNSDLADLPQYAELMTKFDNPKYPDQLGALGGGDNARVPWDKAIGDPHSFFGVTRAVLHDCDESPRDELTHLRPLYTGPEVKSQAELARRYQATALAAVRAWAEDKATDDDVRWLDWLLRHGPLSNSRALTPRLASLMDQYRETEARLALPRIVPGMADFDDGFDQPLYVRGDYRKPGDKVPRRFLEVFAGPDQFSRRGSGRVDLAQRIASPNNPLTARVMVNRIWHHVFGTGLAKTVDDFGHLGERPSHPELFDYLAARLIEDGWSVKKMIRALVLTQAFQMSNRASAEGRQADPQNRLLHRYPARRMEAEAIRDSILAASGRLDRKLYGLSIAPHRESENADRRLFPGPLDGHGRRSLYIRPALMEAPKFLAVFNFPGGKVTQGRRDVTNVPAQALALLNDPFVLQQAQTWAKRLVARPDASRALRIDHMFLVSLGRPPTTDERESFVRAAEQLQVLHDVSNEQALSSQAVWQDLAHALFNLKEFVYIP